jgi:hypothetical protein
MVRPFGGPLASSRSVRSALLRLRILCQSQTTDLRHCGVKS